MIRRNLLLLALVISVAFNLGFVVSIAFHRYMKDADNAGQMEVQAGCPRQLQVMSAGLAKTLEPLRRDQAGLTRRLADLIAAPDTDRAEIERCLDQLSSAGRQVQEAVVDAILTQKEKLPEGERLDFCLEVHRCLCDSWSRSGFGSDCRSPGCAKKPQEQNDSEGNKE
jgi:hypothetical protein